MIPGGAATVIADCYNHPGRVQIDQGATAAVALPPVSPGVVTILGRASKPRLGGHGPGRAIRTHKEREREREIMIYIIYINIYIMISYR